MRFHIPSRFRKNQKDDGIQIVFPNGETSFSLYQEYDIKAVLPVGSNVRWVTWSAGPDSPAPNGSNPGHTAMFQDNPNLASSFNSRLWVVGPNTPVTIRIYARPTDSNDPTPMGYKDVTFAAAASATATVGLLSLDDDLLSKTTVHLIRAAYVDAAGQPLPGKKIDWQLAPPAPGTSLLSSQTQTLDDGTTTNGVQGTATPFSNFGVEASASENANTAVTLSLALVGAIPEMGNGRPPAITITADNPPKTLTATYPGASNGTDILWEAYPADQVQFAQRTTQINNGSTQNTITYTGDAAFTAYISASSFNPQVGARDYGNVKLALQPSVSGAIVVSGPSSIPLYQGAQLTATNQSTGDNVTSVEWSTDPDPDYTFEFTPKNPSPMGGNPPTSTVTVTAYGPNATTSARIYARSANPQVFPPVKPLNATFTSVSPGQVPTSGVMDVDSLDGNPVAINRVHPVQATYTKADGTPYKGVSVNWSAPGLTLSLPNPTTTGPDGTTTNGISTNAPKSGVTVTASATNPDTQQLESGSKTLNVQTSVPPLPNAGVMQITKPVGSLTVGQRYEFSVQYYVDQKGTLAPDGTMVTWYGLPENRLTFSGGSGGGTGNTSYTTGSSGVATIQVTASGDGALPTAVIAARGLFNLNTGTYDHSDPDATVSFQAGQQKADEIVVSSASDTIPLFAPYPLTAQHTGTQETVTKVVWSVDPGQDTTHVFTFDPPDSDLTGNGGTTGTTQITGLGANTDVTVTVYARPKPPDPNVKLVPKTLTFKQGSVPAGAVLTVVSQGDDPLQAGDDWHVFQAAYLNKNGTKATTPGWDGTITWGPLNDPNDTWAQTDPTPTDANGIATNALQRETPGDVTVTVQATGTSDTDSLTVTFSDDVPQTGQGKMTITPLSGTFEVGQSYKFSVQYQNGTGKPVPNGTLVTWTGFPDSRLIFSDGSGTGGGVGNTSYTTGGTGTATIQVTASDGPAIPTAVIATTGLFNAQTGTTDHSDPDATVSFQAAKSLKGIAVDKPYARTPDTGNVDSTYLQQVIKGEVQLTGNDNSGKTVNLTTVPALNTLNWVKMFDNNGNLLPLDTSNPEYQYVATTGANGVAAFRVGSNRLATFSLAANMPSETGGPSTQLALALVSDNVASSQLALPQVPELSGTNLPILTGKPGFKVSINTRALAQASYPAVLLLNDRVMWEGTVGSQPAGGIDVAYAALKATGNVLVYLVRQPDGTVRESPQPTSKPFSAGPITNAQTGPLSGLTRPLDPPIVQVTGSTIGPADVVNGLPVVIPPLVQPYSANIGDQITIYVYLAGTDALTQSAVKNIAILPHTLAAGDPLLSNKPQPMPIPQAYLAGLGQGTLRMDYKVVTQTATLWSELAETPDGQSTTFTLNATF